MLVYWLLGYCECNYGSEWLIGCYGCRIGVRDMVVDGGMGFVMKWCEDVCFLIGCGKYIDDYLFVNIMYCVFVRLIVVNGMIKSIDVFRVEEMLGVVVVFIGEDFVEVGGNLVGWVIVSCDGELMKELKCFVLVYGKVWYVGDVYVVVIVELFVEVMDVVEVIEVDIEELDVVVNMVDVLVNNDVLVYDEIGMN